MRPLLQALRFRVTAGSWTFGIYYPPYRPPRPKSQHRADVEIYHLLLCRLRDWHAGKQSREIDLWAIIAMGVLKQRLHWDDDRLQDFVNHHRTIRQTLGHDILDDSSYELQTIRANAERMTSELPKEVGSAGSRDGTQGSKKIRLARRS